MSGTSLCDTLHLPMDRLDHWKRSPTMDRVEGFAAEFGKAFGRDSDPGLLARASAISGTLLLVAVV